MSMPPSPDDSWTTTPASTGSAGSGCPSAASDADETVCADACDST
jgi:hypothetical protein